MYTRSSAINKVFIIHQNHDSDTMTTNSNKLVIHEEPEAKHNFRYLGNNFHRLLNILDSTHTIINKSIKKKIGKEEIIRKLFKLPKIFPELSIPIKLYRRLYLKLFSGKTKYLL